MIKGLGIDILANDRFAALKNKAEFTEDVFTPDELSVAQRSPNHDNAFALFFSIKEAFLKALSCGLHFGSFWRGININHHLEVKTSGRVSHFVEEKAVRQFHTSAAQTKRYALGVVVLESED
ncbi:MAG: 4'-phosphopantetheinyl transferase superfamily protein [candidate division WOR-3 bacterium]|nr:MAG: 4'-phosphopantetheinyl transferase superfamily protein [candidate division WOR-3 bacterium]